MHRAAAGVKISPRQRRRRRRLRQTRRPPQRRRPSEERLHSGPTFRHRQNEYRVCGAAVGRATWCTV